MFSILVIKGSTRYSNMTVKAVNLVLDELKKLGCKSVVIDPGDYQVPFLGAPFGEAEIKSLKKSAYDCQGAVICTPEYNGCFSSALMAVIENLGYPSALGGKPIGLVGVAAGQIGAVKALEHLRGVLSHCEALVLPNEVSVARVNEVFDEAGRCLVPEIEDLVRGVSRDLVAFLNR